MQSRYHGRATGPAAGLYLRSRGIDETAARKMLCIGFVSEILDSIEVPALRDAATGKLHDTLNAAVEAEG